jgi:hypothetical protein
MNERLEDLSLLNNSKTFDILYNKDGSIKPFYILSSERDIKETQIRSDENELDFKYSQGLITKEDYVKQKNNLEFKLLNQNDVYNDLIFLEIDDKSVEEIKEDLKKASLNKIDLQRLSSSLSSIIEKKLEDFRENNKNFNEEELKLWNYKYSRLANNYSKIREIESFIQTLDE